MASGVTDGASIRVEGLTRRYGNFLALDGISFETHPGEIVGFLGPNGAGKTTTMRILACFIRASEGSARVAGYDVFTHSLEVRRRIGYLPENVPLYPEMRVQEYLAFRASIKMRGVRRRTRRERIDWALDQCDITDVGRRIIGQLSKGYRQRVGLADSLVHDPEVLILDEPTVGLDPNQTRDIRELVKQLARTKTASGRERTILFSTHIIPWVELVCERVIVIDRGIIVADGRSSDLLKTLDDVVKIRLQADGPPEPILTELRAALPEVAVDDLSLGTDETSVVLWGDAAAEAEIRGRVANAVASGGGSVLDLSSEVLGLEDVFRSLTRDAQDGLESTETEIESAEVGS
jgi:gliding motility-associated transport system ATP-binding protein